MAETPLACELYDFLEIACLYKIDVALVHADGSERRGTPITLRARSGEGEFLVFLPFDQPEPEEINIAALRRMRALVENAHFDLVDFDAQRS